MLGENSDGMSIFDTCRSSGKWKCWVPWLLLTQGRSRPRELTGWHIQGVYSSPCTTGSSLNTCMKYHLFDIICCMNLMSSLNLLRHLKNFPPLKCTLIVMPLWTHISKFSIVHSAPLHLTRMCNCLEKNKFILPCYNCQWKEIVRFPLSVGIVFFILLSLKAVVECYFSDLSLSLQKRNHFLLFLCSELCKTVAKHKHSTVSAVEMYSKKIPPLTTPKETKMQGSSNQCNMQEVTFKFWLIWN